MAQRTLTPRVFRHLRYKLIASFFLINLYPFADLLGRTLSITDPVLFAVSLSLSVVWVIGVYRLSPHILTIYYVLTGSLLFIASPMILPDLTLIVIYSLLAFIGDYASKYFIIGYGYRRVAISLKSLVSTVAIIGGVIGLYVFVSYLLAGASIFFFNQIVSSTPLLFQSFYEAFSTTRIGSLILFLTVIFMVYYALDELITSTVSDTMLLEPIVALRKLHEYLHSEAEGLVKGKDDFLKLYRRTIYLVVSFFVFILFYPLFDYLLVNLPKNMVSYAINAGLWFALSTLIYLFLRHRFMGSYKKAGVELPRIRFIGFMIGIGLLTSYLLLLYYEGLPVDIIIMRSLGIGAPVNYSMYRDVVSKYYILFATMLPYYANLYVNKLTQAYIFLSNIIDKLIKFLWG